MTTEIRRYRFLDELAANAWPGERIDRLGDWQLRTSNGITLRANSVLTNGELPGHAEWLQDIERHYGALGLPAIFQVGDASPEGLDAYLAANGYVLDASCLIMTAESAASLRRVDERLTQRSADIAIPEVQIAPTASQDWISRFLLLEGYPETRRSFYIKLYERMPAPKAFVQLLLGGEVIGVATVVVEGEWAGIFNVVIDEKYRGNGYGYDLLQAIFRWSLAQGADKQYLQVIASNEPALHLYRKLGFDQAYRYHYRVRKV